tara:strand:+ start:19864 stop:20880 length:1017 start_codon:yes stop_codon:yes gene_type:complete
MKSIFLLIFIAKLGITGVLNGGGGVGVVCRNLQNDIQSVELLDLWEAKTLFGQEPKQTFASAGLEGGLNLIFEKLKNSYAERVVASNCVDQDCTYKFLKEQSNLFLQPNSKLLRLRNVTLELTEDSFEVAKPANCKIEQIVNYQASGKILLNQDLFEKMDLLNQIALVAHESYYAFLRLRASEQDSVRTRRAIGYVMAGNEFLDLAPNLLTSDMTCVYQTLPNDLTAINFFWQENPSRMSVEPVFFSGSRMIGLSKNVFDFTMVKPLMYSNILENECPRADGFYFYLSLGFDGPIEFDRNIGIQFMCKEQKMETFLVYEKRGTREIKSYPMTCNRRYH